MSQTPATRRQLRERAADSSGASSTVSTCSSSSGSSGLVSGGGSSLVAKMRTRLSTGTLIMNGTSTIKEKDTRAPPSTPASDSSKSHKDTPSTGSKRQASGEIKGSVPPKQCKITKSDGSLCDPYCWLCHKEDCTVTCQLCPRSYHPKCLMLVSLPKDWVCGECEKLMEAECLDTRSKAMKQISTDLFSVLLLYALDRMRQPGSEVFQEPASLADLPSYSDIVINPMDFSTLEKNIKKKEYGCTEAFLADAKWILHNCVIYNGMHHKLTAVARNVIKSCKHEMAEIEVCPQCYKHSCVKGAGTWFMEPCDPPHPVVWAKLKGYPFWPAKAMEVVKGNVDVRFFGAHDKSVIPLSHVFMLSKEPPTAMKNRKAGFAAAMEEVEMHIKIIREKYGHFDYAPFRTPYDRGHVYMNYKLKGVNLMAAKRFKIAAHGRFSAKSKETEKVSAISKTATAVKSKYSSMASKKSTVVAPGPSPGQGHPQPSQHLPDPSPETPEMAIRKALSDCGRTAASKSRFINPTVSVTDIIQLKILQQQELDREAEKSGTGTDSGEDDGDGTGVREVQTVEDDRQEELVENKALSSESATGVIGKEEMVEPPTADETCKDKHTAMTGTLREHGNNTAESRTTDAVGENQGRQVETEGTVPTTGLEMTNKERTVGNMEGKPSAENSEGVCSLNGENTPMKDQEKSGKAEKTTEESPQNTRVSSVRTKSEADTGETAGGTETGNASALSQSSESSGSPDAKAATSSGQETAMEAAEQSTVPSSPVSSGPESTSVADVTSELPQSGVEYRDALRKTIEACKGKLGIAEVEEVEEPMDASDDEPSPHIKNDPGTDEDAEDVAESQINSDSQDSKISLELEMESVSCSASKADLKSGSGTLSHKQVDTETDNTDTSSSSSSKSDTDISSGKKLEREMDSCFVSGTSETQNQSGSEGQAENRTVCDADDSFVTENAVSFSPSCSSSTVSPSAGAEPVDKPECPDTCVGGPELTPQREGSPGDSESSGMGRDTSEVHTMKTLTASSSHKSPTTFSATVPSDSAVELRIAKVSSVLEKPAVETRIAEASSVLEKAAENWTKLVSHSEKHQKLGASKHPKSECDFSENVASVFAHEVSGPVSCAPLGITKPSHGREVTTALCVASSQSVSESDQTSRTSTGTSSGCSTINPITIADDDEPSLLMEVESEMERDEPLVIDLDDEDELYTNENEAASSQKPNPRGFVKELAPSPGILKSIAESQNSKPQSKIEGEKKKKLKARSPGQPGPVVSSLPTASTSSEPCSMMISDVRSLSGTQHDWREDGNTQLTSPPNLPQTLSHPLQQQRPLQSQHKLLPAVVQLSSQQLQPSSQQLQPSSQQLQPSSQQLQQILQPLQQALEQPLPQVQQKQPVQPGLTQSQTQLQSAAAPMESSQSQAFRMPPTPPVEQTQGNSSSPSRSVPGSRSDSSGGSSATSSSSVERPAQEPRSSDSCLPTLSPASVSLVNKYSQQIVGNMQLQLAEMSKELLSSAISERESLIEERLTEEKDQLQWTLAEVQHNHKMTIAEMKACWKAEMTKALQDLREKMTKEKEEAVAETKKKQWCADCWKEALYYCCWNTSYCSYSCQQHHWAIHQHECRQETQTEAVATTITSPAVSATPAFVSIRTSSSDKSAKNTGDKNERFQTQKINIQSHNPGTVNVVQGEEMWRNRLPQNIQILSPQVPLSSQAVRLSSNPTQSLQQFQYLQNLASNAPSTFQPTTQVQLVGPRPMVNAVLPSNAMVFPIVRHSQPGNVPTSQNLVLSNPLRYSTF